VSISPKSLLLEGPQRDIDELAVVYVPAAFPRRVRNDPLGNVVHLVIFVNSIAKLER
jgi:hypothetical protein